MYIKKTMLNNYPLASSTSMSMSIFLRSYNVLFLDILIPLRHVRADLNRAKDVLALIHETVFEYCSPFLIEIKATSRLCYCKHSFPIPPVDIKISGVNVPCSMSKTLLELCRFFSFSLLRYIC